VLFDGDCGFCTAAARWGLRRLRAPVTVVAWQAADLDALHVTPDEARSALQWIGADGTRRQGHRAVAAWLVAAGGWWGLLGRLLVAPGLSPVSAAVYRAVAANRGRLSSVAARRSAAGRGRG
jgi:predicted DCC family thiol-disulfide oxidoreductase YuxK